MKKIIFTALFFAVALFSVDAQNCQLRTQTMGGWGAKPAGNNPGKYLHSNFAGAFPGGLTIGCNAGFTLKLTSAAAVSNFLPSAGTPRALNQNYFNPANYKNTLAGQVAALALSVGFSNYDPNFAADNLGTAVINSGTFAGWTVQQFLDEANKVLGGCPSAYSVSQINAMATKINESFPDGVARDAGLLSCDGCPNIQVSFEKIDVVCPGICDGEATLTATNGAEPYTYIWENGETNPGRVGLCEGTYYVTVTDANDCSQTASVEIILDFDNCPGKRSGDEVALATTSPAFFMSVHPNPVQNSATLVFSFDENLVVTAEVVTIDGRNIKTIFNGMAEAGKVYSFLFDAAGLSDGVYFFRLIDNDGEVHHKKLLITK